MEQIETNIDYSEDWLIQQIIKEDFKSKKTKKENLITIRKIDLYKMFLQFIKLNRRGE